MKKNEPNGQPTPPAAEPAPPQRPRDPLGRRYGLRRSCRFEDLNLPDDVRRRAEEMFRSLAEQHRPDPEAATEEPAPVADETGASSGNDDDGDDRTCVLVV